MLSSKVSGTALAALVAVGSMGVMADAAFGRGQSIGICSLDDVNLFSRSFGATQCGNFKKNDNIHNFEAFGQTWTFLGKDEDDTIQLTPEGKGEVKRGTWAVQDDLRNFAESLVVVLKASDFYSAYLFEDLAQYNQALKQGTFTVDGVTKNGKAGLSHMSIYYQPRQQQSTPPAAVPEPTMVLSLLAVAGVGARLQQRRLEA
jgi:hypothetical protein